MSRNPHSRILAFTKEPNDWKSLLARPEKQWRIGYSARTLAHCWEAAAGFPPEVAHSLGRADESPLADLIPILAIPEFKVHLPGGNRASQNDIFVLARSSTGPVTIMVEGKVRESFGPSLKAWRRNASPGKKSRIGSILRTLGLSGMPPDAIRYQLLHRAASAVIIGKQYRAAAAILLIHSFSEKNAGWSDYQAFTRLFGVEAKLDAVQRLCKISKISFFGVWVLGDRSFLQS